jgi:mRNA-degrading endonuclease RelE of RelBE toxin-antitoxin system
MTDKNRKLLQKLNASQRSAILEMIRLLKQGQDKDLDIKPLKGYKNLYRVRVGRFRIIFRRTNGVFDIVRIVKRDDHTYDQL